MDKELCVIFNNSFMQAMHHSLFQPCMKVYLEMSAVQLVVDFIIIINLHVGTAYTHACALTFHTISYEYSFNWIAKCLLCVQLLLLPRSTQMDIGSFCCTLLFGDTIPLYGLYMHHIIVLLTLPPW